MNSLKGFTKAYAAMNQNAVSERRKRRASADAGFYRISLMNEPSAIIGTQTRPAPSPGDGRMNLLGLSRRDFDAPRRSMSSATVRIRFTVDAKAQPT